MKISGRHKSVPNEIKLVLKRVVGEDAKIVMQDICSCRHAYTPGHLRITGEKGLGLKIRAYFGSGIVNLFVKCKDEAHKAAIKRKLAQ